MRVDRRIIGTLALAVAVLLVGLTGTAWAAVVGLERVLSSSAATSSNKNITTTCPAGKQLLGAGASAGLGNGHVLIEDIRPNEALTSLTVKAVEDETGTTATWFVQAVAICAQAPPGLQRVAATSANNSADKGVTASCPAGKRVLGAGGDINTSNGQVLLDGLRPNSSSVALNALEDETGNAANWSLTAYAICANPVAGLERLSATGPSDSANSKVNELSCPAGKQVVGGGGEINSANGQVVADAFVPGGPPGAALTTYRADAFEDDTGNPANWSLTTYAICANSAQRVVVSSPTDSNLSRSATANCPDAKGLTGAGAEITGGLGQVVLRALLLDVGDARFDARAFEDEDGTPADWSLRAYAICATPLPGLEPVTAISPSNSSSAKSVTASCPAGKRVVGAGWASGGPAGELAAQITPNPALTSVTASGFEDETGVAENWSVQAIAACASPPPGLQLVSATSELHSEGEVEVVRANCPAGKNLLGTGAEIPGGAGQVLLDDVIPSADLSRVLVTGVEDQNGFAGDWRVTAYAICANP